MTEQDVLIINSLCKQHNLDFDSIGLIGLAYYLRINHYNKEANIVSKMMDNILINHCKEYNCFYIWEN